jgi:prepilin-type processing-associated H-X9-DG protein
MVFMVVLFFASNHEAFALGAAFIGLAAGVSGILGFVQTRAPGVRGRPAAILGLVAASLVLAFMFLVPTMGRAREAAQRIKCGSNMRQIGQALRAYVMGQGVYPPDLETLVANSDLVDEVLICASSNSQPGPPPYQLGRNCDFMYLASGLGPDVPGDQIVLIEPVLHPAKDGQLPGANVLYADGSVRLLTEAQARALFTAPIAPQRSAAEPARQPTSAPASQ